MPTSIQDQKGAQDHYVVLSLPKTPPPSEKTIRKAYHSALLLHHPDKSKSKLKTIHSIDQITAAYKTLINPSRREAYDREIALNSVRATTVSATQQSPGLETVDLDDMNFAAGDDDGGGIYWRGCRCGEAMAYEIHEKELEAYAEEGEIVTGCQGCSLWLRVLFASIEDDDEDEDDSGGGKEG